ncbi:hypothetical protein CLV51_105347 [Chitinophaga niastensis]|uniref:Beta-lactamase superfamily II metal-dependent hydrolase n=1 Tax=Chitinophaga niastensis TaxID=536980 RepID=A0A2P8HFF6_CHINA|nr:hypothetical protein [Chitinophaga niastensis]PSL44972.1 hypothetical protein CLV51_105347 [Chitinophaga niastensis]
MNFLCENLNQAETLLKKIDKNGIPRSEPFAGRTYRHAPIQVVGPSKLYYQRLLSNFRDINLLFEKGLDISNDLQTNIFEALGDLNGISSAELLNSENDNSSENNSSVVILFTPKDQGKYLFTSDAGPESLDKIIKNYDVKDIHWLCVPHHGSRKSLTTKIIQYLNPKIAFISADGSKNFPHKCVIAELRKIGCKPYSTHHSGNLLYRHEMPSRSGYTYF